LPLADLNGLARFAKGRNLVSAHVPSHFKRGVPHFTELFKNHLVGLQPRRLSPSPEETTMFKVFFEP